VRAPADPDLSRPRSGRARGLGTMPMARLSPERLALLRRALAARGLGAPCAAPIPLREERATAPLSFAQERLYFLEAFQPGTPLHNDALVLRIDGALDPSRLAGALGALQGRHEILRTSFELAGDGPRQRIHDACELPLRRVDLAPTSDAEERAAELVRAHARVPFSLERAPLWRWLLVRLDESHAWLACAMHHLVSDGATFGILLRELEELYEDPGAATARAPSLQFGDYAAWERASLDPSRAASDLAYWKRHLAPGPTALAWPGDSGVRTGSGGWTHFTLSAATCEHLGRLARAEDCTHGQVLLAAWFALLAATSGAARVTTGVASSLRRRTELADLPGFFVQTLALRVDVGDDPDFRTLLARTRAAALDGAAHADLPYDRVARALETRGGPPLLSAYFSHMHDAIRAPRLGAARCTWQLVDPRVARFDLSLVVHEAAGELGGFLEHDSGALGADRAHALAARYVDLVEQGASRPSQPMSELTGRAPARRRPPAPFAARRPRTTGEAA